MEAFTKHISPRNESIEALILAEENEASCSWTRMKGEGSK